MAKKAFVLAGMVFGVLMMKKKISVLMVLVMVIAGVAFTQQLQVTRVDLNVGDDGGYGINDGVWPRGNIGAQWDSLFEKYKLVPVEPSDPFTQSDGLADRIMNLAGQHMKERHINTYYTAYLTMGNRRFICFGQISYSNSSFWVYELK
ncbi:MAG: hypothetical protein LBG84_04500 [Treponema sp.]|nr:hypothetical protein [Treponema sp.]